MRNLITFIFFFIFTLLDLDAQNLTPIQCASGSGEDQILYYNEDTKEVYIQSTSNDGFYENLQDINSDEIRIVKYSLRGNGTLQFINSLTLKSQIFSPYSLQKSYYSDFSNQSKTSPKFFQYRKIAGVEYEIINGDTSYLWPNTKLYVDIYDHNLELLDSNKLIFNNIDFYNCFKDITEVLPISYKNKTYFNIKINPGYSIFCGSGVPYNIISVYDNNTKTVTKEISDNFYSEIHHFFLNDNLYVYSTSEFSYDISYCQINKYDSNDTLINSLSLNNQNLNQNFFYRQFLEKPILFQNRIILQHIGTNDWGLIDDRVGNGIISIDTSDLQIININDLSLYGSMERSNIFYYNVENYSYFKNSENNYIYYLYDSIIYFIDEDQDWLDTNRYYFEFNKDMELINRDTIFPDNNYYWRIDLDFEYKIYLNYLDSTIYRLSANNDTLWKSNVADLLNSNISAFPFYRHVILANENPYAFIPFFGSTQAWPFPSYIRYYMVIKINLENGRIDEKKYYNAIFNNYDDAEFPNNEYIVENNLGDLILISNINQLCGNVDNTKDIQISNFLTFNIDSFNTIYGKAFVDYNTNNIQDLNEPNFNKGSVKFTYDNNFILAQFLNQDGTFSISTDTGTYVSQLIYQDNLFSVNPLLDTSIFSTYNSKDTIQFALQPIGNINDASISLINTFVTRPGMETTYLLTANNKGNQLIGVARIALNLDSNLTLLNSSLPYTIIDDSIVFILNNLQAAEIRNIYLNVSVSTNINFNDTLNNLAHISTNATEINLLNNTYELIDVVRGSYDPNDKTASANSIPNLAENTDFITYTIRYENTGNDTAFNIIVKDTLSKNVDWNTLEMLNSSHQYTLNIEQDSILIFTFRNILLPASSQNESASHGYITYTIKPNSSNNTYDVNNTAHIIFDYNNPIATNTTNTRVEQILKIKQNNLLNSQVNIYPNIAKDILNIDVSNMKINTYQIDILDIKGNKVYSKKKNLPISTINVQDLANGIYIINIQSEIGFVSKKVFIQH
jgi:uncharacterized repeat protein (TIGR01451 family)